MPWWAWFLVDVAIVVGAIVVVVRVGWGFWKTARAFLREMSGVLAAVPKARDLGVPKARDLRR